MKKQIWVLIMVFLFFGADLYAASGDLVVQGNFNLLPAGTIIMYGGSTPPPNSGWLLCDGSAVSRTTYATLFAAIGTTYGAGDGSTTFNLPDFRRRVPVGAGGTGTATLGNAVGNKGGEETHVLTVAEMPSHSHMWNYGLEQDDEGYGGSYREFTVQPGSVGSAIGYTGGSAEHNIMQPSLVVNYIIKY